MAMNLAQAKEAIKTELDSPTFNADSVGKIEGIIAELEAAKEEWREDSEMANLHERYIAKFASLSTEVKENLASQISTAKGRQEALKAEVTGIEIPASVLGNETLMKELQSFGIVRGDRAVFENSDVAEKVTKYIDYLNFIHDVERDGRGAIKDPEGLVKRYRELLIEGSDWIIDKRFLQYKYIEALYDDIIRRGYVLQKTATGEYAIVCPEIGNEGTLTYKDLKDTHPNHPYLDIVNKRNTRNLIDVAVVTSIMRKNFSLDRQGIVGQKTLIVNILQQHDIRSKDGASIQKADLLALDWGHVQIQINKKLESAINPEGGESMQAYNELMYVRNFIEHKEYDKPDYSADIFAEANTYRQGFLNEKSLIDAFGGNIEGVAPDDFVGRLKEIHGSSQFEMFILAIIAFFTGYKKAALGLAGVALVGDDVLDGVDTFTDDPEARQQLLDQLEIIRPHEINPNVKNPDYQKAFNQITTINKENLDKRVDGTTELPYVNNVFILARITNAITEDNIDIPNIKSGDNISDMATHIHGKMTTKVVSKDEFPNYRGENVEVKEEDITAYLRILTSDGFSKLNNSAGGKENEDRSLRDYLSEGLSIESQPYGDALDITGIEIFDTGFDARLRQAWNGADESTRRRLQDIQEILKEIKESSEADRISEVDRAIVNLVRIQENLGFQGHLENYKDYFNAEQEIKTILEEEEVTVGELATKTNYKVLSEEEQTKYIATIPSIISKLEAVKNDLRDEHTLNILKAQIDEVIAEKNEIVALIEAEIAIRNREETNRHREEAGLPPLNETPSRITAIETPEQFTNFLNSNAEGFDTEIQDLIDTLEDINVDDRSRVMRFLENRSAVNSYSLLKSLVDFANNSSHDSFDVDNITAPDGSIDYKKKVIITLRNKGDTELQRITDKVKEVLQAYFNETKAQQDKINDIVFDYTKIGDSTYISELVNKIDSINISRLPTAPNPDILEKIGVVRITHSEITPDSLTIDFNNKLNSIVMYISSELLTEESLDNLNIVKDTIIPKIASKGIDTSTITTALDSKIEELKNRAAAESAARAREDAVERTRRLGLEINNSELIDTTKVTEPIVIHLGSLQSDLEALAESTDTSSEAQALRQLANDDLFTVQDTSVTKVSDILTIVQKSEYASQASITAFTKWFKDNGLID